MTISTHALTWSATPLATSDELANMISTHALTWSATTIVEAVYKPLRFQLTRSRGARRNSRTLGGAPRYFNSRAHVERDETRARSAVLLAISTHALTWSATDVLRMPSSALVISTHALTWSATIFLMANCKKCKNFNSRAHVERDRRYGYPLNVAEHFNSRAHVERDRLNC